MADGLRVLITGSNRGIGRETARCFAERGASVALNGRDAERLRRVEAELTGAGFRVFAVPGDISDPEQAEAVVLESVRLLGGLDVLVNNAAVSMRGRFEDVTFPVVDRVIRTNVMGTMMMTVHALPHIRESRGSVVIVSSLVGLWGLPLVSVYSASKMALSALAQSLRTELLGTGVHVGIVHVGLTQHDDDKAILAADGSPYPLAARPGASPQVRVAKAIYRMVRRRRKRMVLTAAGHVLDAMVRISPRLATFLIGTATARVNRIAR